MYNILLAVARGYTCEFDLYQNKIKYNLYDLGDDRDYDRDREAFNN